MTVTRFLPRNERLEHRTTVVVQQVDFIEDHESDELCVGALTALARRDVPLFGRAHDDLRGCDLLLGQLVIASQFVDRDAVRLQTLQPVTKKSNKILPHVRQY